MANDPKDRLGKLLGQNAVNGLDFVEVANDDQTELHVHFLLDTPDLTNKVAAGAVAITGGETIPTVPIQKLDWVTVAGHAVLRLVVAAPGDFSRYTLTVAGDLLDPFFNHVTFSFKARCPSTLDCEPPPVVCPPPDADRPPIDYLAKDFNSFRKALSDFSALRYPEWVERSEADFGVMLMEALCALADDLSYTQDRAAAEFALPTATQRRSVVRHARLVDYEPRPATAARVLLQFEVSGGPIPSGLAVATRGPDGEVIDFETGTGLIDPTTGGLDLTNYAASPTWNRLDGNTPRIKPYYWDESEKCLRAGATEMSVEKHDFGFTAGQALLIDTAGETSADPPRREVVRLLGATETTDPLYSIAVTRIRWQPADALKYDHDLTRTVLAGNLVPATQGRRYTEAFAIGTAPKTAADAPLAVVRGGARPAPVAATGCLTAAAPDPACAPPPPLYLHTLDNGPLVWLAPLDGGGPPIPEVYVTQDFGAPGDLLAPWLWRRSLLDADPAELAYTTEPVRYSPTLRRGPGQPPVFDYDGDDGTTLRFGDGTFARRPDEGMLFHLLFRVGGGTRGNVAADSITTIDPAQGGGLALAVTNPFPAAGGRDAEPNDQVRRLAPYAFRAQQFRAVRPEDYNAAAETLSWVQRAGTSFRWTGSWLTVFTTVDPLGSTVLPVDRHVELIRLLNRYRLAGYEAYAPPPRYAPFDVKVWVCARPDAFRGDVEAALGGALGAAALPGGRKGFFHPDNFTFGDPLERSALEAAAQGVPGVAGVIEVRYRRRGQSTDFRPMPLTVPVGPGEVVLVENDPDRPDRGSLRVYVEGGK